MSATNAAPDYRRHRFPPALIAHAVWRSCRSARSYRDVAELLAERGVLVTYETVRQWCRAFGPPYANALRRRRPQPGDTWPPGEVFIGSNGQMHHRWRAVDQDGTVLAILVQAWRDKRAATRFSRTVLTGRRDVPRAVSTDKRARYDAAKRDILPGVAHRRHTGLNNRAEHARQPTRARAADAAVRVTGARPALPRRVWPDRGPLPPAPPPSACPRLPPDARPTLRHLASGHRHPGPGLSGDPPGPSTSPNSSRSTRIGLS